LLPSTDLRAEDAKNFGDKLEIILQKAQHLVYERIEKKRKKKASKQEEILLTVFKEGDKVWLYVPRVKPGKVHKLTPYWTGPFTVIRKARNDKVYYLRNGFGEELKNAVSLSRLKPFHDRDTLPKDGVSFAIRDDVTKNLLHDGAVARVIRQTERSFQADSEQELEKSDVTSDPIGTPKANFQPELVFEGPKVVEEVRLPLNNETRKMIGHEAYLSDDEQSVILKSRVAVQGKRTRRTRHLD